MVGGFVLASDPEDLVRSLSLFDVPGLEGLEEVCKTHGVSLSCLGGTALRIAATGWKTESLDGWDIFDCVPFSSDVDLVHSGSAEQRAAILQTIYRTVPFAEQLRWEIVSREERTPFVEAIIVGNLFRRQAVCGPSAG
jgi:hypothetical protein